MKPVEQRVMPNPWGDWPGDSGITSGTWSGTAVNSTSALQLLAVYGSNRFICEGISTLPIDTFRDTKGETQPLQNPPWLEQPTADLDRVSWLTQILSSVLLSGNAYLLKTYRDAQIDELIPLDPTKVKVQRDRGRKIYAVSDQKYTSAEILHIPGVMAPGSDVGMSPVEAARQSIGLGLGALETGSRLFGQGMLMSGVIEYPDQMSVDVMREVAREWERRHSGKSKAHLPGVLEGGGHWVSTSISPNEAQFLETRNFTAAEIVGQMFLIDPTEFGLDMANGKGSITYANLEQRNARKVQVTFLPWLVRLERAFSSLLPQPRYVKFNVDGLMRGDTLTQAQAFQIATGNKPWIRPSEVRDILDMPVDPTIDDAPVVVPPTSPQGGTP